MIEETKSYIASHEIKDVWLKWKANNTTAWVAMKEIGEILTEAENVDVFEHEMEMRISNLDNAGPYEKSEYSEGQKSGFEHALVIYRDCQKRGIL